MITGVIKNKVDKIWTDIWAGGITNPLTVIEQLTYLMFIRSLDEKELENEEFENMTGEAMDKIFPQSTIGQSMRWSKFKDKDPREIFNIISQRVFPAIKICLVSAKTASWWKLWMTLQRWMKGKPPLQDTWMMPCF